MSRKPLRKLHLFSVTLQGFDEVKHFKSSDDRRRAFAEVANEVRGRDLALGIILTAAAAGASFAAARVIFRYLLPRSIPANVAEMGCITLTLLGALLALCALHRWGAAKELRRKLVASGVPVCLECGYRLDGLPRGTGECPECGAAVSPHVALLLEARSTPAGSNDTG